LVDKLGTLVDVWSGVWCNSLSLYYQLTPGWTAPQNYKIMASFTINHTCGHSADVQLFGKVKDRESKAEWLANRPCDDCAKAEYAKKNAEKNAALSAQAKEAGLPALQGSDKQVAWANTIRMERLEVLQSLQAKMARAIERERSDDYLEHLRTRIDKETKIVFSASAQYIINNRH
jgi:hypothetical protein